MTTTLTSFLLARIEDDEAAARSATEGPWWYDPAKVNSVDREESVFAGERGPAATTVASTGPEDDLGSMADAAHIARHDPARVLAECEAKRAIVEALVDMEPVESERHDQVVTLRWVCNLLAAIYANHPDYDDSWRP